MPQKLSMPLRHANTLNNFNIELQGTIKTLHNSRIEQEAHKRGECISIRSNHYILVLSL